MVGAAPAAELYAVKVLDRTGSGWLSDIRAGIVQVAAAGNQGPDSNSVTYPARYAETTAQFLTGLSPEEQGAGLVDALAAVSPYMIHSS